MDNFEIKVSVTLIAYKHARYIERCLDSILEQKVNFKYEIIIADDCSNDGTKEILLKYKEKYPDIIVPIINEKNLGVSQNGLKVARACRGKYIAGGEGDDFWTDPNRLQKQVDYLDSHPDIVAVASNYYNVDHNGENPQVALMRWQTNKRYSLKHFLRYGMVLHGNTFLRRNVMPVSDEKYLKLKTAEPTMGDVINRVLLYDKGDIFVLPDILHAHRSGEGSKTSFFYSQKDKIIEYSYMYFRIVDNITKYFDYRYNLQGLKVNKAADILLRKRVFKRKHKIDSKEMKLFFKSIPFSVRVKAQFVFYVRLWRRMIGKIGRKLKLY